MRAKDLQSELHKYEFSLPIMRELSHQLRYHSHLRDQTIGWHCHLTEITAATAQVLLECGARLVMSECDSATTCTAAVEYMRKLGAEIYLGSAQVTCKQVLTHSPVILADTGFQLIGTYLDQKMREEERFVYAASEITTSGITLLRNRLKDMDLPVININGGKLKSHIENYHGVGDGVADLLFQLTGRIWAGRRVAVAGYGTVGAGVSHYLRRLGCSVIVVENSPVQQLIAHYDGYALGTLPEAMSQCELLVTATGSSRLLTGEEQWLAAADGLIVVNVGHWADELNLAALKRVADQTRVVSEFLQEYTLRDSGRKIYVTTEGSPANVVMLSGSPEPTLIHLTTEVLCMNYLAELQQSKTKLPPGEMGLPGEIEHQASVLALRALKVMS